MALKYCYKKYEHLHEMEQFSELLPKLAHYFSNKPETAYFIGCGELKVNNRALDALLITPYAVAGIELKNYADDGDIVRVIDNDSPESWLVYHSNGRPKMADNIRQLSVSGGEFANPYSQAHSNRQKLRDSLKFMGIGKSVLGDDIRKYSDRVPYFIVFTKDLDLESKCEMLPDIKRWLKVTTNNKFISALDSKLREYRNPVFTDGEILRFLNRWGFDDLRDPSEWSRHKYTIYNNGSNHTDKQENPRRQGSTQNIKVDFNSRTAMQDVNMQRSQSIRQYVDLTQKGDLLFLFIMSLVMAGTMAWQWWWESQSRLVNICMLLIVAFCVGFSFYIRNSHKTRSLASRGELVDGVLQVKGVNKFSLGSVALCHAAWIVLAALIILLAGPLKSRIPDAPDTFYGASYAMMRLMCDLLRNSAWAFGIITAVSLLLRLLNLKADTFHESTSTAVNSLAMMPCTRSDISSDKGVAKEFWDDLWKWLRTLIAMSAYATIFWVALTYFFDYNLFAAKYRYWPLRHHAEEVETVETPSDKPTELYQSPKPDRRKKNSESESIPVIEKPQGLVKVTSLSFSKSYIYLGYGESYDLRNLLIMEPQDANEPLSWSVSPLLHTSDHLTIDSQTGIVTCYISHGKQIVVAVTSESGKEATLTVNGR
jgi:uncharacterized membrane-anchored protein